ncbi:nuclear transport factor 2 family protein [Anaeromyxobacter sp. Fw109-5]|uniref:nuclear transport factor 2 family protein n=1 Tax=Anaeromyxobacter sp. (strain Fw109-5) TaxID=404589 RepID=UPI0000ED6F8F|nr:nuclear transport factor 2 family protein [Anaeromyxobacter sp. Fw109-5]ABS27700.1 hypothetical protein Anae109_3519 [Anaeromyxobacter sp. Fw109-5]
MIGALIARSRARRGFDALNRKDLAAVVGAFADDAVFEFPGRTRMSGRFEGKRALEEYFRRWFAERAMIRFRVMHVCVEDVLALGGTNTVQVEWALEEADRHDVSFHLSGVTVLDVRHGKIVRARDYVFEPDVLEREWATPEAAALPHPRRGARASTASSTSTAGG